MQVAIVLALSSLFSSTSSVAPSEGDWPQWRGPSRDGVSPETDWVSEGAEESLWERELGLGYSTVSILDGRLYTKGFDEEAGLDVVWCLDAATGEELWTRTRPAKIWNEMHGGGTLSTPSVDGELVYVLDREGRLEALSVESGEPKWARDFAADYELTPPKWGFAASPLVLGEGLIVNVGVLFALDKKTGELLWKTEKSYGDAYSTPVDLIWDGRPCLAVFDGEGLAVIALGSGEELAFHPWKTRFDINAATPIVVDDRVFVSSGLGRGCAMLRLTGKKPELVWESKVMSNKMSGCVTWQKHLYGFDEKVLKCIDLDGNERWHARGVGNGALLGAGGRLIFTTGEGELVVAAADPKEYRELSRAKLFDEGVCWTTPVLSKGLVYVRNSKGRLVCRDHRGAE